MPEQQPGTFFFNASCDGFQGQGIPKDNEQIIFYTLCKAGQDQDRGDIFIINGKQGQWATESLKILRAASPAGVLWGTLVTTKDGTGNPMLFQGGKDITAGYGNGVREVNGGHSFTGTKRKLPDISTSIIL